MILIFAKDGNITKIDNRYHNVIPTENELQRMDAHFSSDVASDLCVIVSDEHITSCNEFFDGLFAERGRMVINGVVVGKHRMGVPPEDAPARGTVNIPVLQDKLSQANRTVSQEVIEGWDDDMRVKASVWASLVYLKGRGTEVVVPPEPRFLEPFRGASEIFAPPSTPAS